MKTFQFAVVVFLWGIALSIPVNKRIRRWSVHTEISEPAPNLSGEDLLDVLTRTPNIRYSDYEKRLTAIKNSDYQACFITDLDPEFTVDSRNNIDMIIAERVPEVIDSPPAYNRFLLRAGPFITPMCQHMNIYWLKLVAPPLPLAQNTPTIRPQPTRSGVPNTPPPVVNSVRSQHNTPPPLNVVRQPQQSEAPQTPPPLNGFRQPQQSEHLQTPPPLNVVRQSQQSDAVQTPPLLNVVRQSQPSEEPQTPPHVVNSERYNTPPPLNVIRQAQQSKALQTPPPLNVLRQSQHSEAPQTPPPVEDHPEPTNQNLPHTERAIVTPPPLAQEKGGK